MSVAESIARVRNYVTHRTGRRNLDPDEVHGLDTGAPTEATLLLSDLRAVLEENAAMRAITGPPCPKCGHFMKAEHKRSWNPPKRDYYYYLRSDPDACELYAKDVIANHPEIAAEMGLV